MLASPRSITAVARAMGRTSINLRPGLLALGALASCTLVESPPALVAPAATSAPRADAASSPPALADRGSASARADRDAREGALHEPAPPEPAEPPPLPSGTTVLQIGDSMADALGAALRDEMHKSGIQVINRIKTGSHIPVWGGRFSSVPSLLQTYKPDLVIISLGGNDVMLEDPSSRTEHVRRLVSYVGDRPCVWVAPSLWRGETGVLSIIREHSKPCRYFDTNTIAPNLARTKGDPIHPSHSARRKWARILVGWLAQERDPTGPRPWELRNVARRESLDDIYDDL